MADTITEFLKLLKFDPAEYATVNNQVILGSLFWAVKLPYEVTSSKTYAIWDDKTDTLIQWELTDLDTMVKKVARMSPNGSPIWQPLSNMLKAGGQYLTSSYVDLNFGNVMIQTWGFGEVRY